MKCLVRFGNTSMKEDTSAHLSGNSELHGGARFITLVTLKNVLSCFKRVRKIIKCYVPSFARFGTRVAALDARIKEKEK